MGNGFDATTLLKSGQEPWTPRERADRFGEFVPLLDRLLTEDSVSSDGDFYSAHEARNIPGCVQRPRLPFAVAATGPRGMKLAARHGQAWVTTGDPKLYETGTPEQSVQAIHGQVEKLAAACAAVGRDVSELDKILLTGFTPDRGRPLESLDAFVDFAGRRRGAGLHRHRDPLAHPRLGLRRGREGLRAHRHGGPGAAGLTARATTDGDNGA